jgi:hypothetical protein
MYLCNVLYQVGRTSKYTFQHQTKEYPETISEQTWSNLIILERNYRKPVKILEVVWEKSSTTKTVKENVPDIHMPDNQLIFLKTKIAQLTNQGLNAREISREIRDITKSELIKIIMGYQSQE